MRMTQRARRTAIALVTAAAIGGSGVAVGAATTAPTPAATSAPAASVPAAASSDARASYADVVRKVLPSVVLISTSPAVAPLTTRACVPGTSSRRQAARPRRTRRPSPGCWPPPNRVISSPSRSSAARRTSP
jgi:S1-C subfamily serine protease